MTGNPFPSTRPVFGIAALARDIAGIPDLVAHLEEFHRGANSLHRADSVHPNTRPAGLHAGRSLLSTGFTAIASIRTSKVAGFGLRPRKLYLVQGARIFDGQPGLVIKQSLSFCLIPR